MMKKICKDLFHTSQFLRDYTSSYFLSWKYIKIIFVHLRVSAPHFSLLSFIEWKLLILQNLDQVQVLSERQAFSWRNNSPAFPDTLLIGFPAVLLLLVISLPSPAPPEKKLQPEPEYNECKYSLRWLVRLRFLHSSWIQSEFVRIRLALRSE